MGSFDQAPGGRARRSCLTLQRMSWAIFVFWQICFALLLWRFSAFLHMSSQDAAFFDQAGRQRLLAHQVLTHLQMVKEGHREDRARLVEHAELFEKGLSALERGLKEHRGPHAAWREEPEAFLAAVRAFWDDYRRQLEDVARLSTSARRFPAAYAAAIALVPRLVEAGDAYVKAEIRSDAYESRRMNRFLQAMAALNLIISSLGLLAFHYWFLQPMEVLQTAIERFEGGDFSARAERPRQGEILSLIDAFNSMAQSVDRSSSQLRDILDNSPAVIFTKDLESRYILVNRRYETLFHQPSRAMKGKTDFDVFPKEAAEKFMKLDRDILRLGRPLTIEEEVPQDGGLRRYLTVKFPLRDSSGAPYGLCAIATDVTEQKNTEEQLRQSQKMDAVGRLAGGVAHDFNNILTSILGYCSLLRDQVASGSARADLDEIRASGERAAALTHQLLAFSRNQTLSPKVLDLNAVVSDLERMLKRLLGENVALSCRLSPELGRVKADKSQLEQVILNLAVNARDAMPGGGSLTIETSERELDEAYCRSHPDARPGRYARLAVTDTGTGMDARTQSRIFEPFFTTKELGRGTGLGLSMVYGIVRQSGGRVVVRSEPGRGASFKVYLPVVAEELETEKKDAAPVPAGAGEVVLLVEDEEPLRRLTARLLSTAGYSVLEAADAESALALFRERCSAIRLLLADVVLPKNNGRWLAEELQKLKPALKTLYMSGYADDVIAPHGVLDPGVRFLPKPFTSEALLVAVRSALDA